MKNARKTLNAVGFRYTLFALSVLGAQYLFVEFFKRMFPDYVRDHVVAVQLILTILSIYVVGFLVIFLLTRKMPVWNAPDRPFGAVNFLKGICKCATINVLGGMIGTLITFLIQKDTTSAVEGLLTTKEYHWLAVLVAGVCAPIFEEFIFRKFLIDHLAHRGKWLAIVTSGLLFGLYHGNFSQCVYATGLGMFFAYIYVQTGRIRYTIAFHMMINMQSVLIAVPMLEKYSEIDSTANLGIATIMMLFYLMIYFSVALTGFVFWIIDIVRGKSIEVYVEGETVRDGGVMKAFLSSWGIWLFLLMCVYEFVQYYLF